MSFLTDEAYISYWGVAFDANNNVFYCVNASEPAIHICYFNGNTLELYKDTSGEDCAALETSGFTTIENFLTNNEPLETFTIQ